MTCYMEKQLNEIARRIMKCPSYQQSMDAMSELNKLNDEDEDVSPKCILRNCEEILSSKYEINKYGVMARVPRRL